MQWNDDELDRLMSRRLDGEATPAEELQLERSLLRSPEARERMAVQKRIDGLAGVALRGAVAPDRPTLRVHVGPPARWSRPQWGSLLALAAAVALAAGLTLSVAVLHGPDESSVGRDPARPKPMLHAGGDPVAEPGPTRLRRVGDYMPEAPYRRKRQIDRDYIVIEDDEAERYYLLEMNRTRTVIIRARGDL